MKKFLPIIFIFISFIQQNVQAQWNLIYDGDSGYHLYSIFFTSNSIGYAAGSQGRIIKTTDAGANWVPLSSGITEHIQDIYFPSSNVGYAVASAGKVIKTTDAGATWTTLTTPSSVQPWGLNDCHFINDNIGFVSGDYGILIKTIDGGNTWQVLNPTVNDNITSINFIDTQVGFAISLTNILKTTDGGLTWNIIYTVTSGYLIDLFVTDSNNMYAVGRNVGVKTTNGGAAWTQYSIPNSQLYSVLFINPTIGYAVGYDINLTDATIKKTIDGGITWTTQTPPITYYLFCVTFVDGNVYASGAYEIVESTNEKITGLEQTSLLNTKSNLFPNPFHDQASVEIRAASNINAECIIYDYTGTEVLRIKNIHSDKFNIDRTNLNNGLYSYQLINNNIVISTGKFIIN